MNDTPREMVVGAKGEPVELAPILGAINRSVWRFELERRLLLAAGDYNASFAESNIESLKDAAALVKRVVEVERERDAARQQCLDSTRSVIELKLAAEAERDAMEAEAQEREGDGWIACSERMPEPGTEVLVYLDEAPCKNGSRIAFDCWDEQYEAPVSWSSATIPVGLGWDSGIDFYKITHWQPLPQSPKATK
jgi:Protein of unknown function (DUF551)